MFKIIEHNVEGYPARTKVNVAEAHITIAIAADFLTAGEMLTKETTEQLLKPYFALSFYDLLNAWASCDMRQLLQPLINCINMVYIENPNQGIIINFAGNELYWLKSPQKDADCCLLELLKELTKKNVLKYHIAEIRSGGQSGIDEAAVKAAYHCKINSTILAPKDWWYRGLDGHDIKDDKAGFLDRFKDYLTLVYPLSGTITASLSGVSSEPAFIATNLMTGENKKVSANLKDGVYKIRSEDLPSSGLNFENAKPAKSLKEIVSQLFNEKVRADAKRLGLFVDAEKLKKEASAIDKEFAKVELQCNFLIKMLKKWKG